MLPVSHLQTTSQERTSTTSVYSCIADGTPHVRQLLVEPRLIDLRCRLEITQYPGELTRGSRGGHTVSHSWLTRERKLAV